jgi:hypothetical protein
MKNYSKFLKIFLAAQVMVALTMSSCKKDRLHPNFTSDVEIPTVVDNPDENNNNNTTVDIYSQNKIATNVNGLVQDENGNPIPNADVSMHGHTTTTDANGLFEFYGALVPDNRTYVKVTKQGFFTGSRAFITNPNAASTVRIMMQDRTLAATLDASTGGSATLSNGSKVEFPANAVKQANGAAYTGNFDVSMSYMDPEDPNFGFIMPGDLDAVNEQGELAVLHSFGMMNVELTGSAGEELQLASGVEATITVPVPSSMLGDASATIPLWWFDEDQGIWKEDGEASLQGGVYVGQVSHFTSWNCDWQGERANIEGYVYDCNGNPMAGITVYTDNQTTITDANGYYTRWVPASPNIVVDVSAASQLAILASPVSQVGPLTAGQTVQQDLNMPCPAYLDGDLVDCNAQLISGSILVSSGGNSAVYAVSGSFNNLAVPANATVSYTAFGSNLQAGSPQSVTTGAQGSSTSLGQVQACGTVIMNSFELNGGSYNNTLISVTPGVATGYYTSWGSTIIQVQDANGGYPNFQINFNGNSTGTYTSATQGAWFNLSLTANDSIYANNFTLNVTTYDAVGGNIAGTFSGDYTEWSTGNLIQINNGQFSVIRDVDQ